jgi:cell division protein FtsQ
MQINWNKIILVFVLIFSIGVLFASNHINNARLLSDIDVVIKPNSSFFISADSIKKSINKYIYASKDSISLSDVEHEIDKNTFVEKAQVYTMVGNKLYVNVKQKEPVARIITNDSIYYLDKNSNFMSLSKLHSADVPIIFGFNQFSDLDYLTKVSLMIRDDKFLNQNITQIIINDNQEINLKLSGLNTFIELGHNNKLEKKIQNLKAFYNRAIRKNDMEKYRKVNLQFENQVVGVKKQ